MAKSKKVSEPAQDKDDGLRPIKTSSGYALKVQVNDSVQCGYYDLKRRYPGEVFLLSGKTEQEVKAAYSVRWMDIIDMSVPVAPGYKPKNMPGHLQRPEPAAALPRVDAAMGEGEPGSVI